MQTVLFLVLFAFNYNLHDSNNIIIYYTLQHIKKKEPGSPTLFSTNYDFYPFTAPTTRLSCTCLLKKK